MPQTIEDADLETIQPAVPQAGSLIVLLGAFDPAVNDKVRAVFNRVVVPVAISSNALIVDNAGTAGCAPLIAAAAVEQDSAPSVIGIIENERPAGEIEPNHARVLRLPPGQSLPKFWFQTAAKLAPEATDEKAVALLFGGGAAERKSVLWCVRRGWPVLVTGDTGGLADDIIRAPGPDGTLPATIDPELREILENGEIPNWSVNGRIDDLSRMLISRVTSGADTTAATLKEAWQRYDAIDQTALEKQGAYRRIQFALIWLAVVIVFLSILKSITFPAWLLALVSSFGLPTQRTYEIILITMPIILSILAGYNSHFRDGNKWILLRGAAEAIKREIFRFRAQAGVYSDAQCGQTSRETKLMAKLTDITSSLEQSEVNKTNLPGSSAGDVTVQTMLSAQEYVKLRIQDQIDYFTKKTKSLHGQLVWMQLTILIAGGAGTLFAAIKWNALVALATAIVTAFTTKLQADQTETSLIQYNQTLATLRNIEAWWKALSPWEKTRPANRDLLVDQTEKAMETETAGWVQQMQSALDKLTEKESQQAQPAARAATA